MAYNNANLTTSGASTPGPLNWPQNPYIWQYTTTDNMATVLGSDPISGNHYFYGENKFRGADWIGLTASDGYAVAYVTNATTTSADVTIHQWNP